MIRHLTPEDTIADLVDALRALESEQEGAEFMREYREITCFAVANVGYAAGYCDVATMRRIQRFTGTEHPIFGRSEPTVAEAFEAGRRWMAEQLGEE